MTIDFFFTSSNRACIIEPEILGFINLDTIGEVSSKKSQFNLSIITYKTTIEIICIPA